MLDTSVFCTDIHYKGTDFTVFKEGIERLNWFLLVPNIVRDETIEKYRLLLNKTNISYQTAIHDLQHFMKIWEKASFPEINQESLINSYVDEFPCGIEKSCVEFLPYPNTTHEEIAKRAIRRKKPFKENGSGYRDCLICDTLKIYLNKNSDIKLVFISGNHRDYFYEGRLHPEIACDFSNSGANLNYLECFQTIREFNDKYLICNLKVLDDLKIALQSGTESRFNLRNWIKDRLVSLMNDDGWASAVADADFLQLYVTKCEEPIDIELDDVRIFPSGDILLSFSTQLNVELSVHYDGNDYDSHYETMCDLFGEPDGPISSTITWASIKTYIALSLVLADKTLNVKTSQIDEIEGRSGCYQSQPRPLK